MKNNTLLVTLFSLIVAHSAIASETEHGHNENEQMHQEKGEKDHGETSKQGHEEGAVVLSAESMKMAGIVVETLNFKNLATEIKATAEVKLNAYLSSKVAPRINAQVLDRHAVLGDMVKKNQPLVSLSSVAMAEAVSEFLVAHQEWQRVKKLGKSVVSAKRYNGANIQYSGARAKIIAYGMTELQVNALITKNASQTFGQFQLLASQSGVIVRDDFIEGELIEPGRVLFDIVNEDKLWAESQLSPKQAANIKVGAIARVYVQGNGWIVGKVVQKHHLLDEKTRTIGVRIAVDNQTDKLHPGMFVDVQIQSENSQSYLAMPTAAVLRSSDGDWVVFVEQDEIGEFKPVEVEVLKTIGNNSVIKGIKKGTKVVVSGAFFVQSELAKSGFSVHNH